jgi:high-affinity iron transporter
VLPRIRPALTTIALGSAVALVACGEDRKAATAGPPAGAAKAVAEIGATRAALDRGLAAFKAGDKARAQELVSEGYVQHFEEVEGPLEKLDHVLKEKLEETIAMGIRDKIAHGAPAAEVEALVGRAKADLTTAEQKLK